MINIKVHQHTKIFFLLILLLLLSYLAAFVYFNPFVSFIIALVFSFTKGALILIYFMHLKIHSLIIKLYAIAGILWLGIFLHFSMNDYFFR